MTEEYLTDDEQLEQVKRVVAQNWVWVAGGVVLGAVLVFGYRYYDSYRNDRALRAAAQFDAMTAAVQRNDHPRARQVAAGLIAGYPGSPYADQADLLLARLALDDGKPAEAIGPLTQVMKESKDADLALIARLRLARLSIDLGKPDDALATLVDANWGAFASRAHEIRGDAYLAKKDPKAAASEYQAALGGSDAGGVEAGLLRLKLEDLGVAAPPVLSDNKVNP